MKMKFFEPMNYKSTFFLQKESHADYVYLIKTIFNEFRNIEEVPRRFYLKV